MIERYGLTPHVMVDLEHFRMFLKFVPNKIGSTRETNSEWNVYPHFIFFTNTDQFIKVNFKEYT